MRIDGLKYALGLQAASPEAPTLPEAHKREHFTPRRANVEAVRDCALQKTQISPSLPCAKIPTFRTPEFLTHARACSCHACALPACALLACLACSLEASVYYRSEEMEIARNYFSGALNAFELAEVKLKNTFEGYKEFCEDFIVDIERRKMEADFKHVQLEFLIELSYFELSQGDFATSDEHVVRIHEIMSELTNVDPYLRNEVYNVMVASAELRKSVKTPNEIGLELELENLRLSPGKDKEVELQKTPESKAAAPKLATAKIVKDEEIPKRRKVIKLNLDEASEEDRTEEKVTRSKAKKPQFKMPVPVTAKPVLESMTPRPTRSRPGIVIQQPSLDQSDMNIFTPKSSATSADFFTPCQSTPGEQFFTPMTSLKTYSRRIIKNLEKEFSTPKGKENPSQDKPKPRVETGSVRTLKDRRVLKRATSPGKLLPSKADPRPRRLRQPTLDK